MGSIDLYADENAPYVKQTSKVYIVRYPRPAEMKWDERYALYVEVGLETRELHVQPHSMFLGKTFKNMDHGEQMDVYSFLCEWDFAQWRRIGPEDSELFATSKLIDQGERFILPVR